MSVKIAVIGLHQIGISIGMALKPYKDKLSWVGYDSDKKQQAKAEKLGAFQKVENDLAAAVKEADLVVFALPSDEVHEMVKTVAGLVKENCQILDTSLLHQGMDEFASGVLPENCHFVSATPILNPRYLDETPAEMDEPHEDLFQKGALLICGGPKTHPSGIKLAADLAELIGAHPYFTDPLEADAILANVELLPKLVSAALMNATVSNPAWGDARRLAGKSFLKSTAAVQHFSEGFDPGKTALQARETSLVAIDQLIDQLQQIRNSIELNDTEGLKDILANARKGREEWLIYRNSLDWTTPDGTPQKEPGKKGKRFSIFHQKGD